MISKFLQEKLPLQSQYKEDLMEQTFLRTFWISKFSLQNLKRRMGNGYFSLLNILKIVLSHCDLSLINSNQRCTTQTWELQSGGNYFCKLKLCMVIGIDKRAGFIVGILKEVLSLVYSSLLSRFKLVICFF